jgi:hypothetical protein
MRVKFKDNALDEKFEKDGYIVIPNCVNAEQVTKMRQVLRDYSTTFEYDKGILNTLLLKDNDLRIKISEGLMEQINPSIDKIFFERLPFYGYSLIKPTSQNTFTLHRDASTVNEDLFEYITIWLPLVNVTQSNGCMYVIPGSQKLFTSEVPFGVEWPYPHLAETLKKYAIDLPMKAGDLLLFSDKTLHGSYPNQSQDLRPVVSSVLIHPDTEMLFYYYNKDNNLVKAYEVDPWFYFRNEYDEPVGKYPLKKSFAFNPPLVSLNDIKDFFVKNPVKTKSSFSFLRKFGINLW